MSGEELWQLTLQTSPVGVSLVGLDGQLLAVNQQLCDMLGYDDETLVSLTFPEITHPDDLELDLQHFEETLSGDRASYRLLKRHLHADGRVVWGDLSVALLRDDDGAPIHFLSQVVDVTDREESRQRLAAAEATIDYQRLMAQAVYETVDVGLVLIDASGRYEAMNRRHRDFMELAFPDGHDGRAGQLGDVYAGNGTTVLTAEQMPSRRAADGEEFDDVRVWVGADPRTRVALSVSARSVRDADGTFVGAALAYKDVTDYVRALAVKDDFVALLSQELRTPLSSVLGHLEMVVESGDLPDDVAHRIGVVERNAVRMRQPGRGPAPRRPGRGRDPARARRVRPGPGGLGGGQAARPAADEAEVGLETQLPATLPVVVDCGRVRQVLDTLVSHGISAAGAGGTLRLTLDARPRPGRAHGHRLRPRHHPRRPRGPPRGQARPGAPPPRHRPRPHHRPRHRRGPRRHRHADQRGGRRQHGARDAPPRVRVTAGERPPVTPRTRPS